MNGGGPGTFQTAELDRDILDVLDIQHPVSVLITANVAALQVRQLEFIQVACAILGILPLQFDEVRLTVSAAGGGQVVHGYCGGTGFVEHHPEGLDFRQGDIDFNLGKPTQVCCQTLVERDLLRPVENKLCICVGICIVIQYDAARVIEFGFLWLWSKGLVWVYRCLGGDIHVP